jgi:epoxyqueuosine reductase QueG
VPLSDAVMDEIDTAPTHTYFHHYRTVNALIDRILLQAGFLLQREGWRYLPVPASQTVYNGGTREHAGRYSHKKAAVLAGLGTVGKSALFLHRAYGPRVRLGTLFTDCPLPAGNDIVPSGCGGCTACADACPAHAIKGNDWRPGLEREALVDAEGCNSYMRTHFMGIGRGAVCGICVRVCPMGRKR